MLPFDFINTNKKMVGVNYFLLFLKKYTKIPVSLFYYVQCFVQVHLNLKEDFTEIKLLTLKRVTGKESHILLLHKTI